MDKDHKKNQPHHIVLVPDLMALKLNVLLTIDFCKRFKLMVSKSLMSIKLGTAMDSRAIRM